VTPEKLRKKAAELDEEGKALLEKREPAEAAFKFAMAEVYETAADEMERIAASRGKRLPAAKRLASLKGMTPGQIDKRARAISGARADRAKDPFLKAIKKAGFRSMNSYARERLGISPGMLTLYRQGKHPVSPTVAKQVFEDLGLPADKRTWPAGVAD
jgi:hypothetical protein